MHKRCSKCRETKPSGDFSPFKRSSDGLFSWCKRCNCENTRANSAKLDPEERRRRRRCVVRDPESVRRSRAKQAEKYSTDHEYRRKWLDRMGGRYHGISAGEYAERVSRPCEICGKFEPRGKRGCGMHVDHDHRTKRLRGTLCHRCNRGVGYFLDEPVLLRAAAEYVERYI